MMEQKVYMNEQLKAILKRNRVLEVLFTSCSVFCCFGVHFILRSQAEIEHALKHNQKIKKTEEEYEAAWEAANLIDNQANGVTGAGPQAAEADTEQAELPPDNYYHEQLRRLSAKSPLSTTKFVPPAGNRSAKGSKGGSRAGSRGGSRDSSRDRGSPSRSRAASPGSPSPLRPGALSGVLRNAEGLSGKGEIEGGGEEGLGDGEEELDEFQRSEPLGFLPVQSQAAAGPAAVSSSSAFAFPSSSRQLQPSSSLPMIRQQPQQQQQQQSLKMVSTQQSTKSTQQRIPKQETVPTETARWREKRKIKQQRRDQEELNNFLKHKYVQFCVYYQNMVSFDKCC